jgi:hypothetical protein
LQPGHLPAGRTKGATRVIEAMSASRNSREPGAPREPDVWPYDDAAALVELIAERYSRRLLDSLPHPPDDDSVAGEPLIAYKLLLRLCIAATRDFHGALKVPERHSALMGLSLQRRRAQAALNLARRHLIAMTLREYHLCSTDGLDDETLVGMAEREVDRLVEDIGEPNERPDGPRPHSKGGSA